VPGSAADSRLSYLGCTTSNSIFNQLQKDGTYYAIGNYNWRVRQNFRSGLYCPSAGTYFLDAGSVAAGAFGTMTIFNLSDVSSSVGSISSGWTKSGLLYTKNTVYLDKLTVTLTTNSTIWLAGISVAPDALMSPINPGFSSGLYSWTLYKDGKYYTYYDGTPNLPTGTYVISSSYLTGNKFIAIPF
jgi:hypothetical protein